MAGISSTATSSRRTSLRHNILITTQSGNIERVQTFTLGDAYTITPNVVNAAHISILRRVNNRGYAPNDINATTLGISTSALYQIQPNGLQMSEGKFTIGGGTNSVAHFNDNTGSIDDDVTWVRGKHQIAFGGEWVQNQLNIGNVYEGNGIFTFNGEYSGSGPKGGSTIGDQNLDFLMGTLGSSTPFQQSKKQQNALRGPIPSLYVQDTFHATHALTLVGGLRWGPNIMPRRLLQPRRCVQHGRLPREQDQHRLSQRPGRRALLRRQGREPRSSPRTPTGSSRRTSAYRSIQSETAKPCSAQAAR